jgi:hypothetical protein
MILFTAGSKIQSPSHSLTESPSCSKIAGSPGKSGDSSSGVARLFQLLHRMESCAAGGLVSAR